VAKIAIFDSGFGSLSVIKPIKKKVKADIVYFADQKNFPYGTKNVSHLRNIIKSTIARLQRNFHPNLIVVASNTPSLLLKTIVKKPYIIGIFPPLKEAARNTKTKVIAILGTKVVVESNILENYIKRNVPKNIKVLKINASPLVELVESGTFINNKKFCKAKIELILSPLLKNSVDVATLSSTHLPFLLPMLKEIFPDIIFLDPANSVADQIKKILNRKMSKKCTLKIFTSGDAKKFHKQLLKIGIKNKVFSLRFS